MENLSITHYTTSESFQGARFWEDISPTSHHSDLTLEEIILWAKGATINDVFHQKISVSMLFETQVFSDDQPYLNIAYVSNSVEHNLFFSKSEIKGAKNDSGTWKINNNSLRFLW